MAERPPILIEADPDIADMVPDYLDRRRRELPDLQAALARGELEPLRLIGHRVRGSAAGYGCADLGTLGAQLEDAALARDATSCTRVLEEMTDWLSRARPA